MPYKRTFTLQEVHDLICESEGRDSPATGASGHTVSLHADGRDDIRHRDKTTILLAESVEKSRQMNPQDGFKVKKQKKPGQDSRFTSRADMVKAVYQALNSGAGQAFLQRFDADSSLNRNVESIPLSTPIKNIERHTKSTGVIERGLVCHSVKLIVDRHGDTIHLQTAFPDNVT